MKKLKLIIDCDDTIADSCSHLIATAKKVYGIDIKKSDLHEWDLKKVYPDLNLSGLFNMEGFFAELEPFEDAIYYTRKLVEDGHEIIIATASPLNGFKDKSLWLQKHFPHIPERNLILVWRKDCISGDIMLDDGLHNISASICTKPVIFTQPWNDKSDLYDRVSSWEEFYNYVQELQNVL